jgi:hypothetical protein
MTDEHMRIMREYKESGEALRDAEKLARYVGTMVPLAERSISDASLIELLAEVDRLRAETEKAGRLLGEKEVENIRLRAENRRFADAYQRLADRGTTEIDQENVRLRAELGWFTRLWPLAATAIDRLVDLNRSRGGDDPVAVEDMWRFLGENPKP